MASSYPAVRAVARLMMQPESGALRRSGAASHAGAGGRGGLLCQALQPGAAHPQPLLQGRLPIQVQPPPQDTSQGAFQR